MPFKEFYTIVAAVATWGHQWKGKKIRFHTDSYTVFQIIQLRRARTPAMGALLRLLYLYCARFDCFIGAAHIPGVDNDIADAISHAQFDRFFRLAPKASPHACEIPNLCASKFFSGLGSSAVGRNCLRANQRCVSTNDIASLPGGIPEIQEVNGFASPRKLPVRTGHVLPEYSAFHRRNAKEESLSEHSELLRGGSTTFCQNSDYDRRAENDCSSTKRPLQNELNPSPAEKSDHYRDFGTDRTGSFPTSQRQGYLGGDSDRGF